MANEKKEDFLSHREYLQSFLSEPEPGEETTEPNPEVQAGPEAENLKLKESDKEAAEAKAKKMTSNQVKLPDVSDVTDHVPKTPISVLLLLIFVLLVAIVPVSGTNESRLSLLWGAFTGRVRFGGVGNSPKQTGDATASSNHFQPQGFDVTAMPGLYKDWGN